MTRKTTLPTDSEARKGIPLFSGPFKYIPAALVGMARVCKSGNDKHNPGQPLHHARGKSADHGDCILRHLMDLNDLVADYERRANVLTDAEVKAILEEVDQLFWRAGILSQEVHERFEGVPLAPAARLPELPIAKVGKPPEHDHELNLVTNRCTGKAPSSANEYSTAMERCSLAKGHDGPHSA